MCHVPFKFKSNVKANLQRKYLKNHCGESLGNHPNQQSKLGMTEDIIIPDDHRIFTENMIVHRSLRDYFVEFFVENVQVLLKKKGSFEHHHIK